MGLIKQVLIVAILGTMFLEIADVNAQADNLEKSYPIAVRCTSQSELCDPAFSVPIETGSILQVKYIVPNHCSPISLHIYVDDILVRDTSILGWPDATGEFSTLPLDTGFIDLGPVSPGNHMVSLKAEGHLGGCNIEDYLLAWEGTLVVKTSPLDLIVGPEIDKYNQIKQYVGPDYTGPIQIQRIAALGAVGMMATITTIQVNCQGEIEKAWEQEGYGGGLILESEIGYAMRKSDEPPTAGLEVFAGVEGSVGPVKVEGEFTLIDGKNVEFSQGVSVGGAALSASTSSEGWVGVGNLGVGGKIFGDMRTEEPKEIDPNSVPDKFIFELIYALYGPTEPLPTDPAKMSGTRSDLTQFPRYPSDEAND